ncbi:hypothetical protein BH24ACT15_BH24ACT15_16770 [soil metagenome]
MESEPAASASSRNSAANQLKALHDAQLSIYTRYPTVSRWYPPIFGLLAAAMVVAFATPPWLTVVLWVVVMCVAGIGVQWYLDTRGVIPSGRAPPAIRREMRLFYVGYCLSIAGVIACYLLVSWWAAALLAFVIFTALITVYEARYARAAEQVASAAGRVELPRNKP